jgi:serine/threonine protein kinase
VKISDFGLSRFLPIKNEEFIYGQCGTPCYIAPEILSNIGYRDSADMFSLGSVFFNLLTGRYLFEGENTVELLFNNKNCSHLNRVDIFLKEYSSDCRDLLKKMLSIEPNLRPTAEQALSHSWFK